MSFVNNTRTSYIDTVNPNQYDNVDSFATMAEFPTIGVKEKYYIDLSSGITYIWNGSSYVTYIPSAGDIITHINDTANPHAVTKAQVGLSEVPNLKQNLIATTDPDATNDNTEGYSIGSKWVNTVLDRVWFATDVSTGAANWVRGVSLLGELDNVNVGSATATQALLFDGANWVPGDTLSTVDISPSRIVNIDFDALFNGNTEVHDSSDNALIGTLSNLDATNLVAGKFSNCLYFDDNNNLITFPYTGGILDFEHSDAWTVSFWMRTTDTNIQSHTVCGSCEGSNGSGWKIEYQANQNRFEIKLSDNSSARQLNIRWDLLSTINNNAWHHVVFVHRGGSAGYAQGSCDLYFDGVNQSAVKTIPNNSLLNTDSIISTQPFTIGGQASGGTNLNDHYIDELVVFNFALVQESVESIYNNYGSGITTYTAITTSVPHNQDQNTIIGLVNRLNDIETTNTTQDTRMDNHVGGTAEKHPASDITAVAGGNTYAIGADVQTQINQLDAAVVTSGGQVDSVNSGTNITVDNTDAENPIVNLNATITGLTSIATTNGTISTAPSGATDIVNKTYADTKVSSVTSANTNLLTVGGTATAPTLTNVIGTHQPPLHRMASFPTAGGERITVNSIGALGSTTTLTIGKQPFNRGDDDYYEELLRSKSAHELPFRLKIVESAVPANYAEFTIHTLNTTTATYYEFGVTYDVANSSVSSFTIDNFYKIVYCTKQRTIASGTNINVVTSADKETVTINTTGVATSSDLTTHTGDATIHFTEASIDHTNILNKGTNTHAQIDSHIGDATIHFTEASININNVTGTLAVNKGGFDVDRANKNLLPYSNTMVHYYNASSFFALNSVSYTADESMDFLVNTGTTTTDSNVSLTVLGNAHPQRGLISNASGTRNLYWAIKLTGSNFSGADLQYFRMGWCSKTWLDNVEGNVNAPNNTFQLTWNVGTSSNNRGYTMSFLGTNGYINYNASSNIATRTGYTTDANAAQNDVLVTTFDHSNNNVILYWIDTTPSIKSTITNAFPSGSYCNNNFLTGEVVPYINFGKRGDNWGMRVMSHREVVNDGIDTLLTNPEPCFY